MDLVTLALAKQYTDKQIEKAEMGESGVNIDPESIGAIPAPATAEIGQTIVVKSVDDNWKPTEWEMADLPSGGSGGEWKLVADVTLEEDVARLKIDTAMDGSPIADLDLSEIFMAYNLLGVEGYASRYSQLNVWFYSNPSGGYNASFADNGNGYSASSGFVHAVRPQIKHDLTALPTRGLARSTNALSAFLSTSKNIPAVIVDTVAGLVAGSRIAVYGR